jgi:hypothetical protein
MSFQLNSFVDLIKSYPSWETLKAFLVSTDGGSLRVLDTPNPSYSIIRYVKGKSDFTKSWVREARSIVWDVSSNRPVCFAPIKAEKGSPPKDLSGGIISDFVDGTMINAFRPASGPAIITTRTSLGAENVYYDFYSNPPLKFSQMFNEALSSFGGYPNFLDTVLKPGQFASFVLQHPHNRIVAPVSFPRIFVTQMGSVNSDGSASITVDPPSFPVGLLPLVARSYEAPVQFKDLCKKNSYVWQGLVFQDSASPRRWRLRNSSYTVVRTLRGAEACGFERFLRLRREGSVKEYLKTYRDESKMMWAFETLFRTTTQNLYDSYVDKNKLKKKEMKEIDLPLRPHVYALHGKYLQSVKAVKEYEEEKAKGNPGTPSAVIPITKEFVIDYVNTLSIDDQKRLVGTSYSTILASGS